jgi:hypothetical protein
VNLVKKINYILNETADIHIQMMYTGEDPQYIQYRVPTKFPISIDEVDQIISIFEPLGVGFLFAVKSIEDLRSMGFVVTAGTGVIRDMNKFKGY